MMTNSSYAKLKIVDLDGALTIRVMNVHDAWDGFLNHWLMVINAFSLL